MSKPSYATYVKDRCRLRRRRATVSSIRTWSTFPAWRSAFRRSRPVAAQDAGLQRPDRRRRSRRGRGRHRQPEGGGGRTANGQRAFISAASPGVISLFFRNDYYPSQRPISTRSPRRCGRNTRRSSRPALTFSSIAPISPWAGISSTPISSCRSFASGAAEHVEALNARAGATFPPERVRMHLCWGNYEGPHHCDVPLADIVDIVLHGEPDGDLVRSRQSAPCA